jgi:predicted HTH transcriptional regulator
MDQARLDDLDAASMEWAFTSSIKPRSTQRWRTSGRNAIDLLVDFGLATVDEGGDLSLTLACLLLFGKASALKLWADGGTFVRVTVAETGRDPYSQLFEHNIASLLRSLHTRQGLFWSMLSQTAPHECLWELIVNSLMHRNYRLSGPVHIRIVPGHLIEIHNPGGLLRHLKPDTLINGSPVHRNHLLSEAASLLSFCEKSGSGIDLVYYNALCEGLDFPEFLQDGESFGALIPLERRTDFANFLLRRGNEFTVLESILILRHLYTRSAANLDELARVTQRPCAMALTVVRDLERRNVVREAGNGNWTLSTEVLDDMNNPVHSLQRGLFD